MLEPTAFDAQLQHRRSGPHTYLVRGGFLMLEPTSPGLWQSALLAAAVRYGKINNVRDGYEHDVPPSSLEHQRPTSYEVGMRAASSSL